MVREYLISKLYAELVGPLNGINENITKITPQTRYISGIIGPKITLNT